MTQIIYLILQNIFLKKSSETLFTNALKLLVFIFMCLVVFNWNMVIARFEDVMLYIPHITKIYLVSIFVASLFYRGLYVPFKREDWKRLFISIQMDIYWSRRPVF